MTEDEKCKHYTRFPQYAVFIAVFDLLEPGMNGENVKLVSAPMLTQVVDVHDGSVNTDEVMERLFHLTSRVAVWN